MTESDPVRTRLEEWRRHLAQRPAVDHERVVVESPSADEVFAALARGATWRIEPGSGADAAAADELRLHTHSGLPLTEALARLADAAHRSQEEHGVHPLHLCLGSVRTEDAPEEPLVLVPVSLTREAEGYRLAGLDAPVLNPAVVRRVKALQEPTRDWSLPPSVYLAAAAPALEHRGLKLHKHVSLVLFPLQALLLERALATLQARLLAHPLIRVLAGEPAILGAGVPSIDDLDAIDPRSSFIVADADASQLAVLEAVKKGSPLLLVEAPRGTGRTQTAVNLAAEAVALGRTVLFVSAQASDRRAAHDRLVQSGLGALCFEVPTGTRVSEIPRLAPPGQAESAVSDPCADEPERLVAARNRLRAFRRALHEVRWPLDRSLADVLGELATLAEAPRLTWRPATADVLTPELLQEFLDVVSRLAELWHVAADEESPWERCLDPGTGPDSRRDWMSLLDAAARALGELRASSDALARARGLPAPDSPVEVRRHLEIDGLIAEVGDVPRHWVAELDLEAAQVEAESWRQLTSSYLAESASLRERFQPELFELPEDPLEQIEMATQGLAGLVGREAASVLRGRAPLGRWLTAAFEQIAEWGAIAAGLAEGIGLADFRPSLESASRLARLAALAHGQDRPPSAWLDRRVCTRVEAAIEELEGAHARYRAARRPVLVDYRDTVTSLDADALLKGFSGPWKGRMRILHADYHRARAALRSHRLDGRFATDPEGDLRRILAFKHRAASLDHLRTRYHDLLGALEPGPESPLAPARRALATAQTLLDVIGHPAEIEALSTFLLGGTPSGESASVASRLERSLDDFRLHTDAVQAFLPEGRVPRLGETLARIPLDQLVPWLEELKTRLAEVGGWMDRIAALAVSGRATGLEEATDALFALSSIRRFEAQLAEQDDHLRAVFGRLFRGVETDWDAVLAALQGTEKLRGLVERDAGLTGPRGTGADTGAAAEACGALLARLGIVQEDLTRRFEQAGAMKRYPLDERDGWDESLARLEALAAGVDDREQRTALHRLRRDLEDTGLGPLVEELQGRGVAAAQFVPALRRAVLAAWSESHCADTPALAGFEGRQHEAVIEDFKRLDRQLVALGPQRVLAAAAAHRRASGRREEDEPIPIVLASPAAAALLPARARFDLVLLDETAPVAPEDAVAALAHGESFVVFGHTPPDAGPEPPRAGVYETFRRAGAPSAPLRWRHHSGPLAAVPGIETFSAPLPERDRVVANGSPLAHDVASAVRSLGYEAELDFGAGSHPVSVAVTDTARPERFVLGIDCDDAAPGGPGRTVRDRERLRYEALARVGWRMHRVWILDWVAHRDEELARLTAALRAELPAPEPVTEPALTPDTDGAAAEEAAGETVPAIATDGGVEPYAVAVLVPRPPEDNTQEERLADLLKQLVVVEAPVHRDQALPRALAALGVGRARHKVKRLTDHGLSLAEKNGWVERRGAFLYAPGRDVERVRVPVEGDSRTRREPIHIAPEEVRRAAFLALEGTAGVERRKFAGQLAQILGTGKLSSKGRAHFEAALQDGVSSGALVVEGGVYKLP